MKHKMEKLIPGRHYIIRTIKLEIYVLRNLREDSVEVEVKVKPFNGHKKRLQIQKYRITSTKEIKQIKL